MLYLGVLCQSGWFKVVGKILVSMETVPTYSSAFRSPLNSSQIRADKEAAFCCYAAFGLAVASVDVKKTKEATSVASTPPSEQHRDSLPSGFGHEQRSSTSPS